MMPPFSRAAMALLGVLTLLGCNNQRANICPGLAILSDAATRPVLKPGSAAVDPSALVYTVEMTGISQTCNLNTLSGESTTNIRISFRAIRAPSGQAARYIVPYFLAVNQAERIVIKRAFSVAVEFPAGASAVTFDAAINRSVLKLENGRLPVDYQYLAGLEVSPTEISYLQAMGRVTP